MRGVGLPLSAADAAKQWPNAKLDEKITNGAAAYFIRGTQRPVLLTIQRRDNGKTNAEIKVPPFAQAQTLEKGEDTFGLPRPKLIKTAGGTGGENTQEAHATCACRGRHCAGVLSPRARRRVIGKKRPRAPSSIRTTSCSISPSPEGPAVLKLGHKYDLTTVSLVQQLPKPAAKAELRPIRPNSVDALLKQAQQMMREASADAAAAQKSVPAAAAAERPHGRRCACLQKTRRPSRCRIRRKMSNSMVPTANSSSAARPASVPWRISTARP